MRNQKTLSRDRVFFFFTNIPLVSTVVSEGAAALVISQEKAIRGLLPWSSQIECRLLADFVADVGVDAFQDRKGFWGP